MERIRDLLDPARDNLKVHEDPENGIWVSDASEFAVAAEADVYEALREGGRNRMTASTGMNAQSSRSHSIFVLTITQQDLRTMSTRRGRLYLVDLAGSEKVRGRGAAGAWGLGLGWVGGGARRFACCAPRRAGLTHAPPRPPPPPPLPTLPGAQDWGSWYPARRGEADQQVAVGSGQRDQGADGPKGDARSLPGLEADARAAGACRGWGERRWGFWGRGWEAEVCVCAGRRARGQQSHPAPTREPHRTRWAATATPA